MTQSSLVSMFAAAVLAAAACTAAAQQQPAPVPVKMGFVNTERVMREARAAQQAQKSLNAEFQKRDQEIAGAEERLKRMAGELKKNGASLAAAERQKRERDAGELARDIERRRTAFAEDVNQRREEAMKQLIEKTNGIIRRIAEQQKFDIVFVEAAYANARIDITDQVIKALDSER